MKSKGQTAVIILVIFGLILVGLLSFIAFKLTTPAMTGQTIKEETSVQKTATTSQSNEQENDEVSATLTCVERCTRDIPRTWTSEGLEILSVASLSKFSYNKINSKYQVKATFKSNTACVVSFLIEGGKQVGGVTELESFETGEIIIETQNLFDLKIYPHDKYNNMNVRGFQCGGMTSNMLFKFV